MILLNHSHHLHTKHWFIKASRPVNDNGESAGRGFGE